MTAESNALGLTGAGLPLLRDLVHERTGLFYDNGRYDVLSDRLAPLVVERGLGSFLDFYYLLKYDQTAPDEWQRVLDALSVQETYFWREVDQIKAIACRVVPELMQRRRGRALRICSVPCATGEEPLTIAMVLDQTGAFARGPIEIHGGDGSPAAIAKARAGRYRARSFRALPDDVAARYFEREGDAFRPIPELSAHVASWNVVNLMSTEQLSVFVADAPIVFCRNAFIYFSEHSVAKTAALLADLMPTPGYLCVGASESLLKVTDRFALEDIGGALVYVKR